MFEKRKDNQTPNAPSILLFMKSLSSAAAETPDISSVSELCDEWLTNYSMQLQPTTVHSYRVASDCHIKRVLGHIKLDELTYPAQAAFLPQAFKGA